MNREAVIRALYLEFRVACQYAKTWERAEECVALIARAESEGRLPTFEDVTSIGAFVPRGGSASFWMQQVDEPSWFRRHELGLGSKPNVFDTASGLTRSNARRRRRFEAQLRQLERARRALLKEPSP